ncbi:MAG: SDR family NAD(P)-dependent oxidoreductase [Candidatus Dormibacteria bacterium]|jgi:NAD(P)-dependent dehydrogenase (short-subunit alcohol dehydrogenase family)
MGRLSDRTAVVTGAARGLGAAIAVRLAADGAGVVILDTAPAHAVVDEITGAGGRAAAVVCDVTDETRVTDALAAAAPAGVIDILVNNAGLLPGSTPLAEQERADFERYLTVNAVGYFIVTKAACQYLRRSDQPRVINVASRTFFMGNPGSGAYVASKGAVYGLTRVFARELGADGITVNAVMPGMVPTDGTRAHHEDADFERVMMNQAIKRQVMPADLANLVAFLAGDEAAMITGQSIICDGGGFLH